MPLILLGTLLRERLLHFSKYGHIDPITDYSQGNACFVDWDSEQDVLPFPELASRIRVMDIRSHAICYKKTQRGHHAIILCTKKLRPMELVAVQSILNSDPWREALNYRRARVIRRASKYWRTRWNILYDYKV